MFEDRGEVTVKGAAAPIRMFLVEAGGGDANNCMGVTEPLRLPALEVKEQVSFGSMMLPRLMSGHHSSDSARAGDDDGTLSGLLSVGRPPSSSQLSRGCDSHLVMGWD